MNKPYQDREFLYHHYVIKRRNMTDICEILDKEYNVKISHQALYNWCKKFDLLKYRGKGRKLNAQLTNPKAGRKVRPKPVSPVQQRLKAQVASRRKKNRR